MTEEERKIHYIEQLNLLIEKNRRNLDNALLRICALGVPLSIAFHPDVFTDVKGFKVLWVGFIVAWTMTVVSVLVSHMFTDAGLKGTKRNVKSGNYVDDNRLSKSTWFNRFSSGFFFLGLILLIVYTIIHA